jgi:hypothetical protein
MAQHYRLTRKHAKQLSDMVVEYVAASAHMKEKDRKHVFDHFNGKWEQICEANNRIKNHVVELDKYAFARKAAQDYDSLAIHFVKPKKISRLKEFFKTFFNKLIGRA